MKKWLITLALASLFLGFFTASLILQKKTTSAPTKESKVTFSTDKMKQKPATSPVDTSLQTVLNQSDFITKSTSYFYEVCVVNQKREIIAYASDFPKGQDALLSASTIKLFILMTYFDYVSSGLINPNQVYYYQEKDRVEGSGIILNSAYNTAYSYQTLAQLMISESDNIAANVLIDILDEAKGQAPFTAVNEEIEKLGYAKSHLYRKMMDISNLATIPPNVISAKEVSDLLMRVYGSELEEVSSEQRANLFSWMAQTENKEKLPTGIDKSGIAGLKVYNKSGESSFLGVENDIALIEKDGTAYVIAVLSQIWNPNAPNDTRFLGADGVAYPTDTEEQVANIAKLGEEVTRNLYK